jgi:hypothetical protein
VLFNVCDEVAEDAIVGLDELAVNRFSVPWLEI